MDAVAARAKVGRMTVYRRFGSKEELTAALARREATRGMLEIAAAVDRAEPIPAQVADGFVAALAVAAGHPLLKRRPASSPRSLLASFNNPDDPLFSMLRGFVAAQITADRGRRAARRPRGGGGDPRPDRDLVPADPGRDRRRRRRASGPPPGRDPDRPIVA